MGSVEMDSHLEWNGWWCFGKEWNGNGLFGNGRTDQTTSLRSAAAAGKLYLFDNKCSCLFCRDMRGLKTL